MAETYCTKSCEHCTYLEENTCPGCKAGPGESVHGVCEIAKCCRQKGHASCESCTISARCGSYHGRDNMPEYRRKKAEAEEADRAARMIRVPYLAKYLWILFWLFIPSFIAGLLTSDLVSQSSPALSNIGSLLEFVCSAATCVIFLLLAPAGARYRKAGIYSIVGALLNAVVAFVSLVSTGLSIIFALPAMVIVLMAEFNEFHAHAEALAGFDNDLAESWEKLWRWYLIMYCVLIASTILMFILPLLSALTILISALGTLIVGILKLVYLYQTATLFRSIAAQQ